MGKGWFKEKERHKLSAMGIKTTTRASHGITHPQRDILDDELKIVLSDVDEIYNIEIMHSSLEGFEGDIIIDFNMKGTDFKSSLFYDKSDEYLSGEIRFPNLDNEKWLEDFSSIFGSEDKLTTKYKIDDNFSLRLGNYKKVGERRVRYPHLVVSFYYVREKDLPLLLKKVTEKINEVLNSEVY